MADRNGDTEAAVDILDTDRDDEVGNVIAGATVIPAATIPHDVEVNMTLARQPEGARCILVAGPATYTLAEAEQTIADLTEATRAVHQTRTMLGFDD